MIANRYSILQQNYTKPYGEIDIVALKDQTVHFIEVKTVSYETKSALEYAVTQETWRPEEMVHQKKLKKLNMVAETWIREQSYTGNVQIDVIAVRLVPRETFCTVNHLENVII